MLTAFLRPLVIVLGGSAYIGLAALGEGGFAALFSHPPLRVLTVLLLLIAAALFFTRMNLSPGLCEDKGNRWVVAALVAIGLASLYLPAWSDRAGFCTLDGDAVRWTGVALFAIGGVLRVWPIFVLGERFSGLVAIQPAHRLVTSGIYGVVRHPSYLGMLLNSLGWGLAFRSAVGVLLTALTVPVVLARIAAEERLLRRSFGAEYEAFCARTARLLPWFY
jgi:protein-S-isoprenylcysteine O-methyltransferase Ste14